MLLVSRSACRLEYRRGNWKSICDVSGEFDGARLDICFVGERPLSFDRFMDGDRAGMSTTNGLLCSTILKDVSVGVKTIGARLGDPFTGESGRATWRAAGGAFLDPLRIESCGRVIAETAGSGGGAEVGGFDVE